MVVQFRCRQTLLLQLLVNAAGEQVTRLHGPQDRVPVAYTQINPHVINAVLAIEDRGFMEHEGLEPKAIIRALGVDLAAGPGPYSAPGRTGQDPRCPGLRQLGPRRSRL